MKTPYNQKPTWFDEQIWKAKVSVFLISPPLFHLSNSFTQFNPNLQKFFLSLEDVFKWFIVSFANKEGKRNLNNKTSVVFYLCSHYFLKVPEENKKLFLVPHSSYNLKSSSVKLMIISLLALRHSVFTL